MYIATGHTSVEHEVVIHCLKPRIHTISKLVGHPRTPLCLTFDPSPSDIFYSGCLGGVVNKWNFKVMMCVQSERFLEFFTEQAGHLLGTFNSEGGHRINSIVSLGKILLVVMGNALHLLLAESLDVLWTARCNIGLLR